MKKQKKINQLFDSMEVAEYFHTVFDIRQKNMIFQFYMKILHKRR